MALIQDPDVLSGNSLQITTATKTILLSACESLSTDGVTIKCVYSKLKELWKSNSAYIPYAFPMGPITDEQFEMVNEWDWENDTTRYLLRTGGWAKKNLTGISEQEYAGIVSLGSLSTGAQVYFQQAAATFAGSAATNFQLTGPVNQAICVYSSGGSPGVFDYRTYLKLFVREWGYTYDDVELTDIGVTTMSYQAYRFPLSNTADPKVTLAMSACSASPLSSISATWYIAAQARTIGPSADNYHVIIDGDDQNAEDIYQRIQYLLKQDSDIDSGSGLIVGKTSPSLLRFVGDTMYTMFYTITPTGGIYIDDFQSDDINRLTFVTDGNIQRTYPYSAVLTFSFGDNLVADGDSKYWTYFTSIPSGDYGDSDAILVRTTTTVGTSAVSRSGTTVSITGDAAHGLSADDGVEVTGVTALISGYNGQWTVVSTPSNFIFTYVSTVSSSESYTADTGGDIYKLMAEKIRGNTSLQRSFDYDQNNQGGRTPITTAPITCVALGLTGAQFVKATTTIDRSTANAVSLVAALERNYQNP
jgi:hypothetical protein